MIDGVQDITNASVVQVATDGTARFTINLNVNGNGKFYIMLLFFVTYLYYY